MDFDTALKKYKKIDNEIGYLNIERFAANKEQYASIESALQNFINSKAIIIDLRNSGGRDGEAVTHLLSYFLKLKKKAVLVGQTTAGAGFMVDAFELPFGFYFVNSIFSPFDYDNGEGWQGSGVIPDFTISKVKAMDKALEIIKNK